MSRDVRIQYCPRLGRGVTVGSRKILDVEKIYIATRKKETFFESIAHTHKPAADRVDVLPDSFLHFCDLATKMRLLVDRDRVASSWTP